MAMMLGLLSILRTFSTRRNATSGRVHSNTNLVEEFVSHFVVVLSAQWSVAKNTGPAQVANGETINSLVIC
jgi:hypothetical protein